MAKTASLCPCDYYGQRPKRVILHDSRNEVMEVRFTGERLGYESCVHATDRNASGKKASLGPSPEPLTSDFWRVGTGGG